MKTLQCFYFSHERQKLQHYQEPIFFLISFVQNTSSHSTSLNLNTEDLAMINYSAHPTLSLSLFTHITLCFTVSTLYYPILTASLLGQEDWGESSCVEGSIIMWWEEERLTGSGCVQGEQNYFGPSGKALGFLYCQNPV